MGNETRWKERQEKGRDDFDEVRVVVVYLQVLINVQTHRKHGETRLLKLQILYTNDSLVTMSASVTDCQHIRSIIATS